MQQSDKTLTELNKIFDTLELSESQKQHLLDLSRIDLSMSKELKKFQHILPLAEFKKIVAALNFMSSKEIYQHYVTRSKSFSAAASNDSITSALSQANAVARRECLSQYPELVEDESITLNKCSTASERVDYISEFLIASFNDRVRINVDLSLMTVESRRSDGSKKIVTIKNYSSEAFARFLYIMLFREASQDEILRVVKKIELNSVLYSKQSTIVQLNDCYVKDGIVYPGFYTEGSLPRFYIDRSVYESVKAGKPVHYCKAVEDLLKHLSNFDDPTYERFLAILSTIFFNNEDLKNEYNYSIRIYGKDGRNGKSLFANLLQRAFGTENCQIFSIAVLTDVKTLYAVANSLVAIDSDSSGKTISEDAAALFKSLTSGERMQIKGLYQKATTIETSCSIIAFSNVLPNSSDKSAAYLRRLEIIRSDYQILDENEKVGANSERTLIDLSEEWFKELRSEEADQYLIELLLVRSQKLIRDRDMPKRSEDMNDLLNRFAEDNDSASAFVHEVGLENIIGFTISEVKEKYQLWCQENDMTELKRKFSQILTEQFGIETIMTSNLKLISESSSSYALIHSRAKHAIRVWRYKDEEKTEEFLKMVKYLD